MDLSPGGAYRRGSYICRSTEYYYGREIYMVMSFSLPRDPVIQQGRWKFVCFLSL